MHAGLLEDADKLGHLLGDFGADIKGQHDGPLGKLDAAGEEVDQFLLGDGMELIIFEPVHLLFKPDRIHQKQAIGINIGIQTVIFQDGNAGGDSLLADLSFKWGKGGGGAGRGGWGMGRGGAGRSRWCGRWASGWCEGGCGGRHWRARAGSQTNRSSHKAKLFKKLAAGNF